MNAHTHTSVCRPRFLGVDEGITGFMPSARFDAVQHESSGISFPPASIITDLLSVAAMCSTFQRSRVRPAGGIYKYFPSL
jgi:hypothetical protein